jgi:hypothetical protein
MLNSGYFITILDETNSSWSPAQWLLKGRRLFVVYAIFKTDFFYLLIRPRYWNYT